METTVRQMENTSQNSLSNCLIPLRRPFWPADLEVLEDEFS